jgi:hypothetical protein
MAREEFLENLRTAIRLDGTHTVPIDSPPLDPDALANKVYRADIWLTPRTVEGFDLREFRGLMPGQRGELEHAVAEFRAVASRVSTKRPAKAEEIDKARVALQQIVEVVRSQLRAEWLATVEQLFQQAETWARKQGWEVKRDHKRLDETLLGAMEIPVLLIHTTRGRLLLDPIARFVVGGDGLVDLCVMPSFDSVRLVRNGKGWQVYPLVGDGPPRRWSEKVFVETTNKLLDAA